MHHVIVRIGNEGGYEPPGSDASCLVELAFDRPADPHAVRTNVPSVFQDRGRHLPAVSRDLFHFAAAAYCADTRVPRFAAYDSWTRGITLHIPVEQPETWRTLTPTLEELLSFLTGDHWELRFRALGTPNPLSAPTQLRLPLVQPDAVALFSGGLDSFIGAIDQLESGKTLGLVSHYGVGTTNKVQERVLGILARRYPGKTSPYGFFVVPPRLAGQIAERTTRSRSLLFLALGALVAAGSGRGVPLLVPENGLISINPPLTLARTGSLSTRTTHPHFLGLFSAVLTGLGIAVELDTPYRFTTKGQMASRVRNLDVFSEGVHQTVSCSHPELGRFWGRSPGQHCGYCVPCIIRRAALLAAGHDDSAHYLRDILSDPPQALRGAGRDLRAFQMAVARFDPDQSRRNLFEVLGTGPIPPQEAAQHLNVYREGMCEVQRFLQAGIPNS